MTSQNLYKTWPEDFSGNYETAFEHNHFKARQPISILFHTTLTIINAQRERQTAHKT